MYNVFIYVLSYHPPGIHRIKVYYLDKMYDGITIKNILKKHGLDIEHCEFMISDKELELNKVFE